MVFSEPWANIIPFRSLGYVQRRYFQRSLFLINVCRGLPEPESNSEQHRKFMILLREIQYAIEKSVKAKDDLTSLYNEVNEKLEKYITDYEVSYIGKFKLQASFENAVEQDENAKKMLEKITEHMNREVKEIQRWKTSKIGVIVWAPEPIIEGKFRSILYTVNIERKASLTQLLCRAIEFNVFNSQVNDCAIYLPLFPQFYSRFPTTVNDFLEGEHGRKLSSLALWERVEQLLDQEGTCRLNLIMNRPINRDKMLKIWNGRQYIDFELPNGCGNVWPIEGQSNSCVLRQRDISYTLTMEDLPLSNQPRPLTQEPSVNTQNRSPFSTTPSGHSEIRIRMPEPHVASSSVIHNPDTGNNRHLTQTVEPQRMPEPQFSPEKHVVSSSVIHNQDTGNNRHLTQTVEPQKRAQTKGSTPVPQVNVNQPSFPPQTSVLPPNIVGDSLSLPSFVPGGSQYDPGSINQVNIAIASGDSKKKGGFRNWMKGKLENLAGKLK